ncbi:MAG: transcriptional regulator [Actinomycetota bacterium]
MGNWRWGVVGLGVAALVALPTIVGELPVGGSAESAATLLDRVRASASVPYSGYAQSSGGLVLPVTSQFTSLADLFGDETRIRVWWQSSTAWRVDTVNLTGESDVHQFGTATWTWNYEANTATYTNAQQPVTVRLPVAGDLLPTNLGRRLLSEANRNEVSRLAARRIAGRAAPGLRLRPPAGSSTISRVDLWVDGDTGLPLRVEVYGTGDDSAVLTTTFLDFSTAPPAASTVAFLPPAGARLRSADAPDLAALINRIGRPVLPERLAGVARNDLLPTVGAISLYGRGVAEFAAVPLPGRTTWSLRRQLEKTPGVVADGERLSLTIGALSVLLSPVSGDDSWLLTGTVGTDVLRRAVADLPVESGLDR